MKVPGPHHGGSVRTGAQDPRLTQNVRSYEPEGRLGHVQRQSAGATTDGHATANNRLSDA